MAAATKFEELIAWQKARQLVQAIYKVTEEGRFSRDFALRDQIRRSAISIMANIAEGFQRRKLGEFSQFLGYALGSIAETHSHLYIALDVGYLTKTDFETLSELCTEVGRLTYALKESIDRRRVQDRIAIPTQSASGRIA